MKRLLSTIAGALALAHTSVANDVGLLQAQKTDDSYVEANMFYSLPGNVSAYTFFDFQNDDRGYFGKTTLTKPVGPITIRAQAYHANAPLTEGGVGLEAAIPKLPTGTAVKLALLPLWTDGRTRTDKSIARIFVNQDLPHNFYAWGCGETDIAAGQWSSGEAELGKKFGAFSVGLNALLLNDGDTTPDVQGRIALRYNFGN